METHIFSFSLANLSAGKVRSLHMLSGQDTLEAAVIYSYQRAGNAARRSACRRVPGVLRTLRLAGGIIGVRGTAMTTERIEIPSTLPVRSRGQSCCPGEEAFLAKLRDELRTGRYRPSPCRRKLIPKPGGLEAARASKITRPNW